MDEYYFLRGNDNIGLISDTSHFYTDAEFSTSHDNSVAKIIAYDLLFTHYLNELKKRGEEITGGTPGKKRPSYILRDPEFYWDFGSFLVDATQLVSTQGHADDKYPIQFFLLI